jgi:hypothetical protein
MVVAVTVARSGVMALAGGGSSGAGSGIMQALHMLCRACGGEVDGWCGSESRSPGGKRVNFVSVPRLPALERPSAYSSDGSPSESARPKDEVPS